MKKTNYGEFLACPNCGWAFIGDYLGTIKFCNICPKCGENLKWQVGYFEYREVKRWWFWKIREYVRFVKRE